MGLDLMPRRHIVTGKPIVTSLLVGMLLLGLISIHPTASAAETVDSSETVSFSTNIPWFKFTSTIDTILSYPSSIDAGDSDIGSLSVTAGTSSIWFEFNFRGETFEGSLASFTTPLGSIEKTIVNIIIGEVKAKFKMQVIASLSSSPSGLVSSEPLAFTTSTSKPFSISADSVSNGSISISSHYAYEGTVEIVVIAPLLGETTVLGPFKITSVGSDNLDTTIPVMPSDEEDDDICFIATAIYGTSTASELDTLRSFRDKVLISNPLGKAFLDTYYSASPPIANVLKQEGGLRATVRVSLIEPIVRFAKVVMSDIGLLYLGIFSTGLLLVLWKKRWLAIALKASGFGVLTATVLTGFIFLLGWIGYTLPMCATVAAGLLPTILPFSIGVMLFKLWKSRQI